MTRDDIICMARESGFHILRGSKGLMYALSIDHMQKFAALVAAAEREACAKVAESYEPRCDSCPSGVANAIRARGQG